MKKIFKMIGCMSLISVLLVGCTSTPIAPDGEVTPNDEIEASLHIGVMDTVDAAPVYLAKENGYFDSRGLDVEVETFNYNKLKDTARTLDIQVMSYIDYLKEKDTEKEILMLMDNIFAVVAKPELKINQEVRIGVVKGGTSEYLADRYLGEYNLNKIYIGNDSLSIDMLKNEEIDMAILPEPMATMAQIEGMEKKIYGSGEEDSPYVMVTTKEVMNEKGKAIKSFKKACDEAADQINKDVSIGRAILANALGIPQEIMEQVIIPKYEIGRKPTTAFEKDITQWLETLE